MCARRDAERYDGWPLELIEAEAARLVARAADGELSWRKIVEPLSALRDHAELTEAHIAAVMEAIG